jgi:hypothetical protein
MATPPNASRTKASKLRKALKAGATVSEVDQLWLADYDEKTGASGNAGSYGRSASSKKVKRTEEIEEKTAAEGTGTAAAHAAGMVLMTREEGRQLDSILKIGIEALKSAVDTYAKATEDMRKDRIEDRKATRELMQSVRDAYVGQAQAEADLVEAQAERVAEEKTKDDPTQAIVLSLIAKQLGINIDDVEAAASAAAAPNGQPKRKPA